MVAKVLENIKDKVFTLEEYFKLEGKSLHKNEFHNGKIIPMPNASVNHNEISGNIFGQLFLLSHQKKTFRTYHSDQKIYIEETGSITYPDVFVVIGKPNKPDKHSISNPSIIFEVASESTFKYDRGKKFKKYQKIPSFQEYVLIDQDSPLVEVIFKTNDIWSIEVYLGLNESIKLQSIDCELKMSDIYDNVEDLQNPQSQLDFTQE